jgi:hypothetical protein
LLLRMHRGTLSNVADQLVHLRPSHAQYGATDFVGRTHVVSTQADPIDLAFRLEKIDNEWKIYHFNVCNTSNAVVAAALVWTHRWSSSARPRARDTASARPRQARFPAARTR